MTDPALEQYLAGVKAAALYIHYGKLASARTFDALAAEAVGVVHRQAQAGVLAHLGVKSRADVEGIKVRIEMPEPRRYVWVWDLVGTVWGKTAIATTVVVL